MENGVEQLDRKMTEILTEIRQAREMLALLWQIDEEQQLMLQEILKKQAFESDEFTKLAALGVE